MLVHYVGLLAYYIGLWILFYSSKYSHGILRRHRKEQQARMKKESKKQGKKNATEDLRFLLGPWCLIKTKEFAFQRLAQANKLLSCVLMPFVCRQRHIPRSFKFAYNIKVVSLDIHITSLRTRFGVDDLQRERQSEAQAAIEFNSVPYWHFK